MVAFLFTDVEASTRRWERYGDAMRAALRRHDEILRAVIEERQGYIFKTIGDAFCAAFSTVDEALDAAIVAQRRLGREDFRAVDGLHVRMAIHVGETDERDGDYFGTAVNRTARLLSAGHGGQILLSGEAGDLAASNLRDGITLRHLGLLSLKDLKEPERVYQPIGHGLRSEFKALRALETPPNNLPRQTTSFVGRHKDLARIEALLDEGPLLTIVGAGGIGKTRVALEAAAARVNGERDGAWFVDLGSVGDAELIAGTIFSALGGEPSRGAEPLDDLIAYLQKRELLLLLDNSEHLVSDVARIVAEIVARCPHVGVLATSRSPLDISSERIYRLSSLDAAASARLFVDRARAVNPTAHLETKSTLVEEICNRLDGIALAIELAAARVRTMSLESVASHLELRLLTGGRDRRPRQQTMRALIDWSYDLLNEDERRVLRRAAVFLRGFTLRLATAVCGDGDDDEWRTLEILASLVDKSLVVAEVDSDDQRYRILEPIREYAWEKLVEAGELPQSQRLHTAAMTSLVAQLYDEWARGPASDWLSRLERDLANLRAALRWSVDDANDLELGARLVADATIVFLRLNLSAEGIEWCDRISTLPAIPLHVEARLRYGMSMLYSNLGSEKKCLNQALIALPLYRQTGDDRGVARTLSQIASREVSQGRVGAAKNAAEEALELARGSGDRRLLADVLRRSAEAFGNDGLSAVRSRYEESVALFRSLGRADDTARALVWWGHWEASSGNHGEAVQRLLDAAKLDSDDGAMMFYGVDIASCYLAIGDAGRAEPYARKALAAAVKARYDVGASLAIAYLSAVAWERDPSKAARLLGYGRARLRENNWDFDAHDAAALRKVQDALRNRLGDAELERSIAAGGDLTEDQAVALALSS